MIALVTGASSGIGEAFAHHLAAAGYDLILVARREARLADLAEHLESRHGVNVSWLVADLTQLDDMRRVEARIRETDDLALLVNSAGFSVTGDFTENPLERQSDLMTVHVTASTRLIHAALPGMMARSAGGIITVSSAAAFLPTIGDGAVYRATKVFNNYLSESLQFELKDTGVKIQALCPGFTPTEIFNNELKGLDENRIPPFMWMTADEVVTESLLALERGRVVVIPGLRNRLMMALLRNSAFAAVLRAALR